MKNASGYLALLISLISSQNIFADGFNLPDNTNTNANPFVRIHSLQGFSGVNRLDTGDLSTRVMFEISNEFHQKSIESEQLQLDYERTTISLDLAYGLNEQFSLGIEIPYLINSGGFLDNLIESWHDLFGLPEGGRENADQDAFLISYGNGNQSLLVDNTGQGIGDISLFMDRFIFDSSSRKIKARAKLKFPTGDEEQLFGSGGYAVSLHLNAAAALSEKIYTYGSAGLSYLTEGDVLSALQNDLVAAATFGIGWQIRPAMMLSAQLDLNSKIYDPSDLDAVSGQGGSLYVSAQYKFSNQTSLQLGFTEDVINKDAVPDFGLRIGYRF